jgi:hypothetical protein
MTPAPPPHPQEIQDAEHLKLLVIFHYVMAGVMVVFGCFPIIHIGMGWMMVSGKLPMGRPPASGPTPESMGWLFIVFGGLVMLGIWIFAFLTFWAGRCLASRRLRTFCFVMACLSCGFFPLGTALGVFTIIVLQRPSVRMLFERPAMAGYLNR